ncbi:MAG: hypothetical protein ACRDPK_08425 [Carbonactinosporaceae bacterium]
MPLGDLVADLLRSVDGLVEASMRCGVIPSMGRIPDELAQESRAAATATGMSRVLTGLAALHSAEAHAMLGEQHACERALDVAGADLSQVEKADAAMDLFSPTQHGRLAGSCYLALGQPKRAQIILEQTVGAFHYPSKSQAIVLGNLALAYIRQRSLDEAAAALHRAIDVVELTWGAGGLNIVFSAGRELRAWPRVSSVRHVDDRLLALVASA